MELHWNESKINQIIGRVCRYKSHETLNVEERNVTVCKWISMFDKKIPAESADEYLFKMSVKKEQMFEQFINIIKTVAI